MFVDSKSKKMCLDVSFLCLDISHMLLIFGGVCVCFCFLFLNIYLVGIVRVGYSFCVNLEENHVVSQNGVPLKKFNLKLYNS